MEFMFRAGENIPPRPCPLPPPLPTIHPNPSSLEALQRELHEVRIKEEILIRRINQRRMLEELTPQPPLMKRKAIETAAENSGAKRRVVVGTQRKEWGCALCMVSATDEDGLRKHIEGKKHGAKAERLGRGSVKNKAKVEGPTDCRKRNGGAKVKIVVDGKTEWVVEKGSCLICEKCGVKCYSKGVMVSHLSGKKHLHDQLKKKKKKK